jgi:hypothetical protein
MGDKMNVDDLSWNIEPHSMIIEIKYKGQRVMGIFLGEAMETAGRKAIMEHVRECDGSPWLSHWVLMKKLLRS